LRGNACGKERRRGKDEDSNQSWHCEILAAPRSIANSVSLGACSHTANRTSRPVLQNL
jgi:hypothetical protein